MDKLGVTRRAVAAQDLVAAITGVVEQRVADVLHVYAYLVGASGLQLAAHDGHVGQVLDGVPVGDGVLTLVAVGEYLHQHAVTRVAPDVARHGTVLLFHLSPHHGDVLALGGLLEELGSERGLGVGCLGDNQQAAGVLVDAVHETEAGVGHVIVGVVLEMPG